jgi:hypothetical protein
MKVSLAGFSVVRKPDGFRVERLSKAFKSKGVVTDIPQLTGPFGTEKEAAQAVYNFVLAQISSKPHGGRVMSAAAKIFKVHVTRLLGDSATPGLSSRC